MRTFKYFDILTAVIQLPQLSLADWTPGKAAQINFYTNGTCTALNLNSEAAWWTLSPFVGGGSITGAECFSISLLAEWTGINIAMMWEESTRSDTVEPDQANGSCTFWDGLTCNGKQMSSTYAPSGAGGGPCQPARSAESGDFWKSVKCRIHHRPVQLHRFESEYDHAASSLDSASDSASDFDFDDPKRYPNIAVHYVPLDLNGQEAQHETFMLPALPLKSRIERDSQHCSPTVDERRRQESVVANELRALREEMVRMSSAMTSGDGNDAHIRALERELHSYADAERPNPSLPRHLFLLIFNLYSPTSFMMEIRFQGLKMAMPNYNLQLFGLEFRLLKPRPKHPCCVQNGIQIPPGPPGFSFSFFIFRSDQLVSDSRSIVEWTTDVVMRYGTSVYERLSRFGLPVGLL
ncbi:hypothetical protein B0H19DRAFT_1084159 [Mycena capillaripes]|nr:hypothetical protein B0H19DRAFT_1084159 [Mycena capillaripes]